MIGSYPNHQPTEESGFKCEKSVTFVATLVKGIVNVVVEAFPTTLYLERSKSLKLSGPDMLAGKAGMTPSRSGFGEGPLRS